MSKVNEEKNLAVPSIETANELSASRPCIEAQDPEALRRSGYFYCPDCDSYYCRLKQREARAKGAE